MIFCEVISDFQNKHEIHSAIATPLELEEGKKERKKGDN
jgi:hypothetical protein